MYLERATNVKALTQSSALRLYWLPKNSQLFIRLGDNWHRPNPDDTPLPTPNRKWAKTTLRDLATKAPAKGLFPDLQQARRRGMVARDSYLIKTKRSTTPSPKPSSSHAEQGRLSTSTAKASGQTKTARVANSWERHLPSYTNKVARSATLKTSGSR